VSKQELLLNERIRVPSVRLIGDDGEQYGVKDIEDARRIAEELGQDLVLVAPDGEPPVCKVMDYGKFKYRQKKRLHEKHRYQPQIKELRLRPKTEQHDMMVRVKQARFFIERGDRVIINMRFRGREVAHTELGRNLLQRFAAEIEDIAKVERAPVMEHRRMTMVLAKK